MVKLEQELGMKEQHFDFIQQHLRTLCLQFGASLVYTCQFRPESFTTLWRYLNYRLFTPLSFPTLLSMRPEVVERDMIFVPAGWVRYTTTTI